MIGSTGPPGLWGTLRLKESHDQWFPARILAITSLTKPGERRFTITLEQFSW